MENIRKQHLINTMKKINKGMKSDFLDFATNKEDEEVLYSGIQSIDKFLGGFKRGAFSILWGGMSVGKSTLIMQTIAHCQLEGKLVCYIDMERSFDKERAKQLGVNLNDLVLVSTCSTAEEALEIIRQISKDKAVDAIFLDSIQSMSPMHEQENKGKSRDLSEKEMAELARTLSKFFRVVASDIYNAKVACILIGQIRLSLGSFIVRADLSGGEALKHWAYINCFMRRGQSSDAPVQKFKNYYIDPDGDLRYNTVSEKIGFDCVCQLRKTKSSKSEKEGSEIHLPFLYDKGFVDSYNSNNDDVEVRIDAKSTNIEKEKIKKILIEKSILKEKEEATPILESPITNIEENQLLDVPKKKRGRPKQEKKDDK